MIGFSVQQVAPNRCNATHAALAWRPSKSHVAGFPIPEALEGINAFTLGMRLVDPQAQVQMARLNTWFDLARKRAAGVGTCPCAGRERRVRVYA
jgi:simple sugar transport system substrate-binding protein